MHQDYSWTEVPIGNTEQKLDIADNSATSEGFNTQAICAEGMKLIQESISQINTAYQSSFKLVMLLFRKLYRKSQVCSLK